MLPYWRQTLPTLHPRTCAKACLEVPVQRSILPHCFRAPIHHRRKAPPPKRQQATRRGKGEAQSAARTRPRQASEVRAHQRMKSQPLHPVQYLQTQPRHRFSLRRPQSVDGVPGQASSRAAQSSEEDLAAGLPGEGPLASGKVMVVAAADRQASIGKNRLKYGHDVKSPCPPPCACLSCDHCGTSPQIKTAPPVFRPPNSSGRTVAPHVTLHHHPLHFGSSLHS